MSNKPKTKRRKIPPEEPLNDRDEDLDISAQVMTSDIEKAKEFVRKNSPRLNALLNAVPIKESGKDTDKTNNQNGE